jgi:hypothetical protein
MRCSPLSDGVADEDAYEPDPRTGLHVPSGLVNSAAGLKDSRDRSQAVLAFTQTVLLMVGAFLATSIMPWHWRQPLAVLSLRSSVYSLAGAHDEGLQSL